MQGPLASLGPGSVLRLLVGLRPSASFDAQQQAALEALPCTLLYPTPFPLAAPLLPAAVCRLLRACGAFFIRRTSRGAPDSHLYKSVLAGGCQGSSQSMAVGEAAMAVCGCDVLLAHGGLGGCGAEACMPRHSTLLSGPARHCLDVLHSVPVLCSLRACAAAGGPFARVLHRGRAQVTGCLGVTGLVGVGC